MHVVEWSETQQAVSINTLEQILEQNRNALLEGLQVQCFPVFASESLTEAKEFSEYLKQRRLVFELKRSQTLDKGK